MTTKLRSAPRASELEEAILGAILIEKNALGDVMDILRPEMFYSDANQLIYEACLRLSMEGIHIDLIAVMMALRSCGHLDRVGGAYYLTQLTDRIVSSANIEHHARIVVEKYVKRELIAAASTVVDKCYDESSDVFDVIGEMNAGLDTTTEKISTKKELSNAALLSLTLDQLDTEAKQEGLIGVPSGLSKIDEITGGWQASDLIVLAARPGMGKTSMAITMAINAAKYGFPVAFFSLEMSAAQIMKKVISIETNISFSSMRSARLQPEDWSTLYDSTSNIANLPIYWDDTPGMTITEIVAKAKRMKRKHGLKMIVVDYLQFITPHSGSKNQTRDQEVGHFSRSLKNLAKELNVPVVALAQLSRSVESRPDKRPMLSDLRESGAIEQDADIVSFLYRDEYYGLETNELGSSTAGVAEFIIAKHRNGRTDKAAINFNAQTTGFRDLINW